MFKRLSYKFCMFNLNVLIFPDFEYMDSFSDSLHGFSRPSLKIGNCFCIIFVPGKKFCFLAYGTTYELLQPSSVTEDFCSYVLQIYCIMFVWCENLEIYNCCFLFHHTFIYSLVCLSHTCKTLMHKS